MRTARTKRFRRTLPSTITRTFSCSAPPAIAGTTSAIGRCAVVAPHRAGDFAFFTAKDAAMAEETDVGLALWDGQSSGTIVNVARLVARSKPAVVYVVAKKAFSTLKTPDDLATLLSLADAETRSRAEEYIHDHVTEFAQTQIF